jgi:hypothetical protein
VADCCYYSCCSVAGFPCLNGARKPDSGMRFGLGLGVDKCASVLECADEADTEVANVDIPYSGCCTA